MSVPVHGIKSSFSSGSYSGRSPDPSSDALGVFECLLAWVVKFYLWFPRPPKDVSVTLYGVDHVFGHRKGVQPVSKSSKVHALYNEVPSKIATSV